MVEYYKWFFKELLTYNKRTLKAASEDDLCVFNNADKVVYEGTQAEVVEFLYKHRDFMLMREDQKRKFWTPIGARKFVKVPNRKSRVELVRTPVAFGLPVDEVLAWLKEDE